MLDKQPEMYRSKSESAEGGGVCSSSSGEAWQLNTLSALWPEASTGKPGLWQIVLATGITRHYELFTAGWCLTMDSSVSEQVLDIPLNMRIRAADVSLRDERSPKIVAFFEPRSKWVCKSMNRLQYQESRDDQMQCGSRRQNSRCDGGIKR